MSLDDAPSQGEFGGGSLAATDHGTLVQMRGITKRYQGVIANDGIDFDICSGEIHALLGENGAGKTTLMNILYGLVKPDAGSIAIRGDTVQVRSPQVAMKFGIGMVHQHFKLVPTLTVEENVILGGKGTFRLSNTDLSKTRERLGALSQQLGLEVSPQSYVWQLSVGQQQRVEILRALYRDAQLLILDEPTASLAPMEVKQFLSVLATMSRAGTAIVLITHHLDEVMAIADRISVLRRGRRVATLARDQASVPELARLMVGQAIYARSLATVGAEEIMLDQRPAAAPVTSESASVVQVDNSTSANRPQLVLQLMGVSARSDREGLALEEIQIDVREGEIVAIAGVDGNGQSELEEVLFALRRADRGTIRMLGINATTQSAAQLLARGVAFIPSDRSRRGLVRNLSVAHNLVLDRFCRPPFSNWVALRPKAILEHAQELIRQFSIQVWSPSELAGRLSGGNAQRVVLARALSGSARLVLAAQPTRGLDVSAVDFVWKELLEERARGVGILLISTDLDEVMAIADRCYVLYRGKVAAHFARGEMNRESIGLAMGGALVTVGDLTQ